MKYRRFGRTNWQVSDIGYGLWGMSGWSGSDDLQSRESLRLAADLGCNFFDTAWAYGDGKSDGLLGGLIANNRDKRLYAASKVPPMNSKWPASPKDPYNQVFPRDYVLKYAARIREKLGTEAIDLLQFHVWDDRWTDEPDFRDTVEKLKGDGLIHYFGLSLNRWEPENGLRALQTGLVDAVQVIYNIFDQAPEDKLLPLCRKLDVGVIARVPLDEGSLGGQMTLETKFPEDDWRSKYFGPDNLKATIERVDQLKEDLPHGMSLPPAALRFILANPDIHTTIVGMRQADHVRENIATSDAGPLEAGLMRKLKNHRWDRTPQRWSD